MHKAHPALLVGFDINPVDREQLLECARQADVCDELPDSLQFQISDATSLPASDATFDAVITWSAFEHISDPVEVLKEVRRVLRHDGVLFLQLWPFFHSQFGSHLRDWFPEGWEHLEKSTEEIAAAVRSSSQHDDPWKEMMLAEFHKLNRITVDDLGFALGEAGFRVRTLQLLTRSIPLPPEPPKEIGLSMLGIEGVELTAVLKKPE